MVFTFKKYVSELGHKETSWSLKSTLGDLAVNERDLKLLIGLISVHSSLFFLSFCFLSVLFFETGFSA